MRSSKPAGEPTFWNGVPARCQRVRVVVGPSERPTWWCAHLAGGVRKAVRVEQGAERFYLDDEDHSGWLKVTVGRGSPTWSHRSLPVEREVGA